MNDFSKARESNPTCLFFTPLRHKLNLSYKSFEILEYIECHSLKQLY